MARPGDAALVGRARAGDRRAFACLVRRHYPLVLALCRRVVGPAALAEDAAQEAVLAAMLQLDRLRRPDRFGPWLAGIGLNLCRLWLRERSRGRERWEGLDGERLGAEPVDRGPDPADAAAAADVARRVRAAVMALPPGQRAAVLLHYLAGLTQPEVAATLGVEPGTVKTRLHKARRALREPLRALWTEETMTTQPSAEPIEMYLDRVRGSGDTMGRAMLIEKGGERALSISMQRPDADNLVVHLGAIATPRPGPSDFAASLLRAARTRVREVVIERLVDDIFYAAVALDGPGGPARIDARPSDAINLAIRIGAPIKVAAEVLATAGTTRAELDRSDAEEAAAMQALVDALGPRAARVLARAREEVSPRFRHIWVGTEHVLLALAEEAESLAAGLLRERGATAEKIAPAIDALVGRGKKPPPERGYTRAVQTLLRLAPAEAQQLGHARAGTGHLLLGLLREGGRFAPAILKNLGVDVDELREGVLQAFAQAETPPEDS
ncbi:MAG TPA: bifunctional nuclease domain-containing protein [Chloroflexota bacterium]|jgi:RNA polymerase sigma factor (sigma-70 family)|nr:bifunctional nuclease domain-containing protein [Chloroflexota bacterium]